MTSFSSATLWSTVNAAAGVLLPTLVFAFFAHIVPVSEVGVVAVGLAWIEMIKVLSPQGFYEQLISHNSDQKTHESVLAVLLATATISYFAYVGVIWISGLWRHGGQTLLLALCLLGLRLVSDIIVLQPQALLVQELRLRRIAMRVVWANLGSGVIGLVLARFNPLIGFVSYYISQSALTLIMTVLGSGRITFPRLRVELLRPLMRNAGYASGVRLVAAMNNYFDQILLSTLVPITILARYNLAKRVETTLITGSSAFQGVLYQPLFARTPLGGRDALLRQCIRTLNVLFGMPVILFIINNGLLVKTVFGRQWAPAATLAAIMAASGLARAYGSIHGALLSVSQRNLRQLVVTLTSGAAGVGIVLALNSFGLIAVALGLLARNLVVSLWFALMTREDMPHTLRRYCTECVGPLLVIGGLGWAGRVSFAPDHRSRLSVRALGRRC